MLIFQLNPAKLENNDENLEQHKETLLGYLRKVLASILLSEAIFPKELRYVFGHLQQCVSHRWPNDKFVRVRVVRSVTLTSYALLNYVLTGANHDMVLYHFRLDVTKAVLVHH